MAFDCINIGLKAKCENPEEIIKILDESKIDYRGLDIQKDTYFKVDRRDEDIRKIKKGKLENYFMCYNKEFLENLTKKEIHFIDVKKDPPGQLERIARKTHETIANIEKTKHIYWVNNIRFSIDKVRDIPGNYISIEAIRRKEDFDIIPQVKQVEHYKDLLNIRDKDLIFDSYVDMLFNQNK